MTQEYGPRLLEFAEDVPAGSAPEFGALLEAPFEHTSELLVLSSTEHSRLSRSPALTEIGGEFESERYGHGNLSVRVTGAPGEVRVLANFWGVTGPAVHFDALVRESWVARAVDGSEPAQAAVRLVRGLMELAVIPQQSTVKVRIDTD